ncbi:MAG: ATP-binding protein [Stigonema ocellatum SAG 48.90 = DSM 106950]|nr:ATP-binding protein [Stigonema ocellatum SAG 48.90 = DSM 106950]
MKGFLVMGNLSIWLAQKSQEEIEHFLAVPRMFAEGGTFDKLCCLLCDFDFIAAKINHRQFGLQTLIDDYNLLEHSQILNQSKCNPQKIKALKLVQGALQLSGSGKSAILAKYVTENPDVIYYNAQLEGKNRADEFLHNVCQQIVETRNFASLQYVPNNDGEGSWLLSLLLQKISLSLAPNQKLIIAIDALDAIDRNSQTLGSNLFYLPRYLPDGVYFLLTRRPFAREKSGLLIETPFQTVSLEEYSEQNREDMQVYIQQVLGEKSRLNVREEELCHRLINQSENNFMYLTQVLSAMEPLKIVDILQTTSLLPPSLITYYKQHWQKMQGQGLSPVELKVLHVLTHKITIDSSVASGDLRGGISTGAIAQIIEEEYEIQEVLENWLEFLQQQQVGGDSYYSFYHWSFRDWLGSNS